MRTCLLFCLIACGSSSKVASPVDPSSAPPATPAAAAAPVQEPEPVGRTPRYDASTFFDTVRMAGASFSPDGTRILVSSNATGVFNVYAQLVAGGAPVQLTKSTTDSNFAISFFPKDDRYLYSVDGGGNELTHIYVAEVNGAAKDLTPGDKVKAQFRGWSKDLKTFYIATNERDPKFFDLYRYATTDYARTRIFSNEAGFDVGSVSPDGRWLALTKVINNADTNVLIADLSTKKKTAPKLITKHAGMVENSPGDFTPDSKKLIYMTDGQDEFRQAWSYDLKTGKSAVEAKANWDVNTLAFWRMANTASPSRTKMRAVCWDRSDEWPALDAQGSAGRRHRRRRDRSRREADGALPRE